MHPASLFTEEADDHEIDSGVPKRRLRVIAALPSGHEGA
jgi:hypothetical protein